MNRLFAALTLRVAFVSLIALAGAAGCTPMDDTDADDSEEMIDEVADDVRDDGAGESRPVVTCERCGALVESPVEPQLPGTGPLSKKGSFDGEKKGSFDDE